MQLTSTKFNSLRDLYIHELKDLYNAESRILDTLPKMADKATDVQLKSAFETHLEETKTQKDRLERIITDLGEKPGGETCEAMKGLVKEGEEMLAAKGDPGAIDAGLIAQAQRVEHYEMAGYGSARAYAEKLGHSEHAQLLQETLDEEKHADEKLNECAVSVNAVAV